MNLTHLRQQVERAKKENALPFMVSATSGNILMSSYMVSDTVCT